MPETTQVLLQRVQTGDEEALDELYNRYLMRVLAAVRARLTIRATIPAAAAEWKMLATRLSPVKAKRNGKSPWPRLTSWPGSEGMCPVAWTTLFSEPGAGHQRGRLPVGVHLPSCPQ